jgi:hypothetical protein
MPIMQKTQLAVVVAAAGLIGCSLLSACSPTGPSSTPVLLSITPTTAAVGDAMTIRGSGFAASGNSLKIGGGYLHGVATSDSTSLRFPLPSALTPCPPSTQICVALALLLTPGTHQLSVINAHGASNELPLQVVEK